MGIISKLPAAILLLIKSAFFQADNIRNGRIATSGKIKIDGLPTQPASKGSIFKGPFHVPRCLMAVDMMINDIIA